ncbi:rRNA large subunit methyltransferase A [Liquorilactobacillus aquaticus DSM 21051]|uniref:rRNA large subunit methyltransferase A n=1 Tax=Liquorilactobacillus aquaticus DSM 21051 TaxID=1423725 RepID=A0A0R2D611_9LACO|nr:methyltransferase domain-containing protein [Liquorilactobacillus aquaticus]KRM95814.1 rRNA large subunit methyltransferase A [Liquorilactobacillus aquaticus DSM 21051]
MKKIERGMAFASRHVDIFKCPVCGEGFEEVMNGSFSCSKGHQFDFSKKGTLYFLRHGVKSDYDDIKMWEARRFVLKAGLFQPIIDEILSLIPEKNYLRIVDVGCGEGSTLKYVEEQRTNREDAYVGFDISKKAINLATRDEGSAFFCIADLAQLPFASKSFDVILDMFSPSAYGEFDRILKSKGLLFKVIPNANYLIELRHMLYEENDPQYSYSNDKVLTLFKRHYPHAKIKKITYEFPLSKTFFESLVYMTPLHWGAAAEKIDAALAKGLNKITIDVLLLIVENN